MLGKGTFIIRRGSTKKLPRAVDIFSDYEPVKHGLSESEPDMDSESERTSYKPSHDIRDVCHAPCDTKESNVRHNFDIGKPLTSPRDRLSLNLEPIRPGSSSKKDHSPIQIMSRTASLEGNNNTFLNQEFVINILPSVTASKKGSLKSLDGRCSNESINVIRTPCHEEAASGFDMKVNALDATNMYVYKPTSNGPLKGPEFPGLLENLQLHNFSKSKNNSHFRFALHIHHTTHGSRTHSRRR